MKITVQIDRFNIKQRKIISTVDRDELMNIGNQILNEWKIA